MSFVTPRYYYCCYYYYYCVYLWSPDEKHGSSSPVSVLVSVSYMRNQKGTREVEGGFAHGEAWGIWGSRVHRLSIVSGRGEARRGEGLVTARAARRHGASAAASSRTRTQMRMRARAEGSVRGEGYARVMCMYARISRVQAGVDKASPETSGWEPRPAGERRGYRPGLCGRMDGRRERQRRHRETAHDAMPEVTCAVRVRRERERRPAAGGRVCLLPQARKSQEKEQQEPGIRADREPRAAEGPSALRRCSGMRSGIRISATAESARVTGRPRSPHPLAEDRFRPSRVSGRSFSLGQTSQQIRVSAPREMRASYVIPGKQARMRVGTRGCIEQRLFELKTCCEGALGNETGHVRLVRRDAVLWGAGDSTNCVE
ncbi:hypothetical protein DFH11DRAFT_1540671 [Phellopilus nigrolimitatus]|nr:hypothetical protein DFH11DRAFT_1540671 [Phellopilus nigrolimitatus]